MQEAASVADKSITVSESEDELVERARSSVSDANWVVGECAAKWTKRYGCRWACSSSCQVTGIVGVSGSPQPSA